MTFLIIIAIIILLTGAGLYFAFPLLIMAPAETGQISNTNIYAVKNAINTVFFIKTDDSYIMIDAGSNLNKIKTSLKEANINFDDVKRIFLTHSDYDHTAALTLFPNADIYMSEDELPLINGAVKRNLFGGNKMPVGIDIDKIILLSNGQKLLFNGTKVECVKAPGHTNGSMLYLVDNQFLFTGDAFKISNKNISVHPFTMDKKLSKKTIDQLSEIINNSSIVLTSHYGLIFN